MEDRVRPKIYNGAKEDDAFGALNTLELFPQLSLINHVTVCEINTTFQSTFSPDSANPVGANIFTPLTEKYIPITEEILKPSLSKKIPSICGGIDDDGFLVKSKQEGVVKAGWDGWNDEGLNGMLKGLRKAGASRVIISIVTNVLKFQANITSLWKYANVFFYPHLAMETEDLIENFAAVRQWKRCWIRAISWHPTSPVLAIALSDDTIRVIAHEQDTISLLKNADQQMVSSLSWRPYTSELAVGTKTGLMIWHVKGSRKPSSSSVKRLTVPGHFPVTSVDYNENGRRLVSSSAVDNSLVIWNTDSWTYTKLIRTGGGGTSRAKWSTCLNGSIFCSTPTSLFRIWTFEDYVKARNWNTARKPVEAFAWSPCGSIIIFVSDCIIYSLNLKPYEIELLSESVDPTVTPLFNLKVCAVRQAQNELTYKAGGKVLQIEWDVTGTRLAVLFSDSMLIPVFRVQKKSQSFVVPVGFIQGHEGELPVAIAFQKNFKEGALLAIAWSTRRIQYFPMLFGDPSKNENLMNQEPNYYINYQNINLTHMSGLISSATKVPVDFGPSFSQFQQDTSENVIERETPVLHESQNRLKLFSL